MKLLFSRFGINRALGTTILSIAMLCALLALATHATTKLHSGATVPKTAAPACAANTVFSASFTQGQDAAPEVVQQWKDFILSLTPSGYDTVTISGSNDTTGHTLTDATIVPQIAAAMQSGTGISFTAGGFTWNVGIGCSEDNTQAVELNANNSGDASICNCETPGYVVRPDIGPRNAS